jgi:RNA polymerase sigma factor (sigma-70 family)
MRARLASLLPSVDDSAAAGTNPPFDLAMENPMTRTRSQQRTTAVAGVRDCILLDDIGQPLQARIARVLIALIPRFRRTFTMLQDDTTIVDVLEEAGRRLVKREARFGPVDRLHAYAWVTLASVAASLLRRGPARLDRQSVPVGDHGTPVTRLVATTGTAAQIERGILIRELIDKLPESQRVASLLRLEGFTSQEIADRRGCSAAAVNVLLSRARQRLRQLAGTCPTAPNSRAHESHERDDALTRTPRRMRRVPSEVPGEVPGVILDQAVSVSSERFPPHAASD